MWSAINESTRVLSPITIGIIDSDVDKDHPEFAGEESAGTLFGNVDFGTSPPSAFNKPSFHGTGVTGTIGANNIAGEGFLLSATSTHMNGIVSGVTGLEYTLELKDPSEEFGYTQFNNATAITELVKKNAAVINFSKGFYVNEIFGIRILKDHIAEKIKANSDTLFVVSAGNNGDDASEFTPATLGDELPNVITVGGVGNADERGMYPDLPGSSNFGGAVNVSAPSEDFYKPDIFAEPLDLDDYSFDKEGTSFSAPMVTGVAGLLKAINPSLSPADIKQIITETADPIFTSDPDELGKTLGSACSDGSPSFRGCRLNALVAVCHPEVLDCKEELPVLACPLSGTITEDSRIGGDTPCVIESTLTIPDGVTLQVDPGAILKFASPLYQISSFGTFRAQGTETEPVIFTSIKDDVGGDTNGDGGASSPAPGDWRGISTSGNAFISHIVLRYAGHTEPGIIPVSLTVDDGTLLLSNSHLSKNNFFNFFVSFGAATATDTVFEDSREGVRQMGGSTVVTNSSIQNNGLLGVLNAGGDPIDARNNWWGDP